MDFSSLGPPVPIFMHHMADQSPFAQQKSTDAERGCWWKTWMLREGERFGVCGCRLSENFPMTLHLMTWCMLYGNYWPSQS